MQQTKHPTKFSKQSFTPPDFVNKSIKQAVCDDFVWHENREWLTSHRVFHSIRFKVNKVGIQWYPIFFALHLGLIGKQSLFFSPSLICAPARPAVCRGVASVCATTQATGLLPARRRRGATHRKGHFPIAPREWCLATETTAIVRWGNCPELIRHCPWFSCTCRHRQRPKARSAGNISCICADSARECHQWPPRRAGNCSKGRE